MKMLTGGTYIHPYFRNYDAVSVVKIVAVSGICRLVTGEIDLDITRNYRIRQKSKIKDNSEKTRDFCTFLWFFVIGNDCSFLYIGTILFWLALIFSQMMESFSFQISLFVKLFLVLLKYCCQHFFGKLYTSVWFQLMILYDESAIEDILKRQKVILCANGDIYVLVHNICCFLDKVTLRTLLLPTIILSLSKFHQISRCITDLFTFILICGNECLGTAIVWANRLNNGIRQNLLNKEPNELYKLKPEGQLLHFPDGFLASVTPRIQPRKYPWRWREVDMKKVQFSGTETNIGAPLCSVRVYIYIYLQERSEVICVQSMTFFFFMKGTQPLV